MRATILLLSSMVLSGPSANSQNHSTGSSGQVSEGEPFPKSIGHGLDFVLMPSTGDGITGWITEVSPQGKVSDPQCDRFAWVITPPYRFGNARYLDAESSTTAQEAVRISPREFSFVLNCADLQVKRQRVDRVLWSYTYSHKDVDEALAQLGSKGTSVDYTFQNYSRPKNKCRCRLRSHSLDKIQS